MKIFVLANFPLNQAGHYHTSYVIAREAYIVAGGTIKVLIDVIRGRVLGGNSKSIRISISPNIPPLKITPITRLIHFPLRIYAF